MKKYLGIPVAVFVVVGLFWYFGGDPQKQSAANAESGGYSLQMGSDFKPGMNAVDEFGISVAVVVDVSGSMAEAPQSGGDPKFLQASMALETVANYLEKLTAKDRDLRVQVAILKFSNEVSEVLPMTVLDADGIRKLKDAVVPSNFAPEGKTAIGSAFEAGARFLAQSGTILNSMIVVTDGENTIGPDPVEVLDAIYQNRNSATTEDLPVRTATQLISVIGFDIESPQFETFHQKGARITQATNREELERSLQALLEADITKLESAE